ALAADFAARVPRLSIDLSGSPQAAATMLWIDGISRPDCARGCALDPGQHLVVARARRAQAEEQIRLNEAESQRLELVFSPDPPAQPSSSGAWAKVPTAASLPRDTAKPRAQVSTLTWALSGVALAGLGTGAVLGLGAVSRRDELLRECAPSCAQGDVDEVRRRAIFANLSLGVGLAAAALAATSYVAWKGEF
ncbi:MAG TPA: hypothetical protein VNG33_12280, partial [Polyangiaceae bacterium]|nr:hypothetical protein [Polyangiaceae bacterium]